MHVDKTTVSKWENEADQRGERSDLLIRTVAVSQDSKLRDKLEEVVRNFERIGENKSRCGSAWTRTSWNSSTPDRGVRRLPLGQLQSLQVFFLCSQYR